MTKTQKAALIYALIFLQAVIAISGGIMTLFFLKRNEIPPNVSVGNVEIGRLKGETAARKLEEYYNDIVRNGYMAIKINDNDEFRIKLSDINVSIDYENTISNTRGFKQNKIFSYFIYGNFSNKKIEEIPQIVLNEVKLREKLGEISSLINREPVNANMNLKDNKVVKIPEVNGVHLNIDNAVNKIKNEIGARLGKTIEFNALSNYEIETVHPKITSKDLEDADDIIAEHSTLIKSSESMDSVRLGAYAINKILVQPADIKNNVEPGEFSFNKYLALADDSGITEKNNEGYNQVVSTLYAAVIKAGIKQESITRTRNRMVTEYIEPGLDAMVLGKKTDFKFKNTLPNKLVIFSNVKDNKLTVYIIGKKQDSGKNDLKVEVEQKYEPSIINVENQDLMPGEIKPVSPGIEGIKVNVYMTTVKDSGQVIKKFISSEKYEAIEAVVQVGPDTRWNGRNIK